MSWLPALMDADSASEYRNGYEDGLKGYPYQPTAISLDIDDSYRRGYEKGQARKEQRNG